MAASSLGLFFMGDPVSSGLQLIRRLMQPGSTDVPHITIRHSDVAIPPSFQTALLSTTVDKVTLEGPGTFDLEGFKLGSLETAFVSCRAPRLEAISYKPDFPDSVFHVTLYAGRTSQWAWRLLELLRRFPWNLQYSPGQALLMSFEEFKRIRPQINSSPASLTPAGARLLEELSGHPVSLAGIEALAWETRLAYIADILERVHSAANVRPNNKLPRQLDSDEHLIFHGAHQASLFSDEELGLWEGPHNGTLEETASVITPPEIAAEVARHALQQLPAETASITLLDPAIGGGVFYAALEAQLAGGDPFSDAPALWAVGVEKRVQRARLTQHIFEEGNLSVFVADFLSVSPSDLLADARQPNLLPNLLLANPPYMRPSFDSSNAYDNARSRILDRLGIAVSKQANLYIYFVLYADAFLAEGAVASWVLPGEVLYSDAAQPLRQYLLSMVNLLSVHTYHDAVRFHRRRVSTVVITYRKEQPTATDPVQWSQGDSLLEPSSVAAIERNSLLQGSKWNSGWLTRGQYDPVGGVELGRLFKVTRGIATGANDTFVVTDFEKCQRRLEEEHLRPLLPKPRELTGSVVRGDRSGVPLIGPLRWLIDSSLPWEVLRSEAPHVWQYLAERLSVAERALPSRRKPFYRQEQQDVPPIVFVSMTGSSRGGDRFVLNESRAIALNNYHIVRPNSLFSTWMRERQVTMAAVHQALLEVSPKDLEAVCRTYHKGSVKLEPGDLRRVTLYAPLFTNALRGATTMENYT